MKTKQPFTLFFLFFVGITPLLISGYTSLTIESQTHHPLISDYVTQKQTPTPTAQASVPNGISVAQKLFEEKLISTSKGTFYQLPDYEQSVAKRGYFSWKESGYSPKNFILRAEANWQSASNSTDWNISGVGFLFRENAGERYYAAFLLLNGYVDVFRMDTSADSWTRIARKRYGKLDIPQGSASLMLVVEEPSILFYVNEQLVINLKDKQLASEKYQNGRLNYALISGTNKDFGIRTQLHSVSLWVIGDETLPPPPPTSEAAYPPTAQTLQGIEAFQRGDYAQAILFLNQAIESDTDYAIIEGYLYRGRAQSALGNYNAAINDFQLAIQLNPRSAKPYLYRGYTYEKMKAYEKALSDFNQAIQLDNNDIWAYRARASLYAQRKGNYLKAIDDYSHVLQLVKDHAADYNNRCWLYIQVKKYDKALTDCNQALKLSPQSVDFLDTRALLYLVMGEKEKAKTDLEDILKLSHDKDIRNRAQKALDELK